MRQSVVQARDRAFRRVWNEHVRNVSSSFTGREATAVHRAIDAAFDAGLAFAVSCALDLRDRAAGNNVRDGQQRRAVTRLIQELGGDVE